MTAAFWFISGAVITFAWMLLCGLMLACCAYLLERRLDRAEARNAEMEDGPRRPASAPLGAGQ